MEAQLIETSTINDMPIRKPKEEKVDTRDQQVVKLLTHIPKNIEKSLEKGKLKDDISITSYISSRFALSNSAMFNNAIYHNNGVYYSGRRNSVDVSIKTGETVVIRHNMLSEGQKVFHAYEIIHNIGTTFEVVPSDVKMIIQAVLSQLEDEKFTHFLYLESIPDYWVRRREVDKLIDILSFAQIPVVFSQRSKIKDYTDNVVEFEYNNKKYYKVGL